METIELHSLPSNQQLVDCSNIGKHRWSQIHLGLIQSIVKMSMKNVSDKISAIISILTTVFISICDTVSDFLIAATLFWSEDYNWAWIIVILDYIPSWTLAAHNWTSTKWRTVKSRKEKFITLIILFLSPFSTALFHLRWLAKFESAKIEDFDYLHHNARLSHLLCGSYESPIQIVILLVLWGRSKLELPWAEENALIDSQGRKVYLGTLSLTLSLISLIKASLDISEGRNWHEKLNIFVYGFCNSTFRLPSFALCILYFNEWSTLMLITILIVNLVIVIRYDKQKRTEFSIVTSVLVASLTPFVSSDQTNIYQRNDIESSLTVHGMNNEYRRHLSAKTSFVVTPLLFLSNLVLLLLLKYDTGFKHNKDIIMEKETTETFLLIFLLPLGGVLLISNYLYRLVILRKKNPYSHYYSFDYIYAYIVEELLVRIKNWCQCLGLLTVFACVLMLFGHTIQRINTDIPIERKGQYFLRSTDNLKSITIKFDKKSNANFRMNCFFEL